ncbi:MutS-related protein [Parasediminibacterium sp. JCM 36343]|uniref:MutS-related protein n=1 Tax=Parasediminibacterium sp. JCM 36343 TaxID=3374279 RepID=UPI003978B12B
MLVDKTTLQDISIFHPNEEQSVFHYLNHAKTNGGREYLKWILANPLSSIEAIKDTQHTIQHLVKVSHQLPETITNGTIMVIESFFDTIVNTYPAHPNIFNSHFYRLFSAPDFSVTRYTVEHFISFVKTLRNIATILETGANSKEVKMWCSKINLLLQRPMLQAMLQWTNEKNIPPTAVLVFGKYLRLHFKQQAFELVDVYSRLDAYTSLAYDCKKYDLAFPVIEPSDEPYIKANGMYHLLLETPVSYDLVLDQNTNFLFLTGANMAGKSTFIKAVGIAVYLAHIGMGVPAKDMELSLFDGLLTNIQVADNIVKGESYFFNEVQRIKRTVEKISDGKKWLILIDELFKGTNVQDAMKCSIEVIEGLHKMPNGLFILSTHLYEIADSLRQHPNISFRYFETGVAQGQLVFSYQLQEGVSNDRLGYLILKREGVVDMLKKL